MKRSNSGSSKQGQLEATTQCPYLFFKCVVGFLKNSFGFQQGRKQDSWWHFPALRYAVWDSVARILTQAWGYHVVVGGLNPLQPGEVPGTERYLAKATSVFGLEIASQKVGQTSLLLSQRHGQLEDKFLCEIWNSRAHEACGPTISSERRACQPL